MLEASGTLYNRIAPDDVTMGADWQHVEKGLAGVAENEMTME